MNTPGGGEHTAESGFGDIDQFLMEYRGNSDFSLDHTIRLFPNVTIDREYEEAGILIIRFGDYAGFFDTRISRLIELPYSYTWSQNSRSQYFQIIPHTFPIQSGMSRGICLISMYQDRTLGPAGILSDVMPGNKGAIYRDDTANYKGEYYDIVAYFIMKYCMSRLPE